MLFHVGGDGSRPTFFEMAAAEHLPTSIKAALLYSLGVWAQRRPMLHKVLDYSDEVMAALMLLLEAHSLRTSDASFGEALYGLRRTQEDVPAVPQLPPPSSGAPEAAPKGISRRQRALSLLFLVGVPYLRSKLHSLYMARSTTSLQSSIWASPGDVGEDGDEDGDSDREGDGGGGSGRAAAGTSHSGAANGEASSSQPVLQRLRHRALTAVARSYPYLHAAYEGVGFTYALLYLLGSTPFYSLSLHLLRLQMNASQQIADRRQREYGRLRGPSFLQAVQRGLMQAGYSVLDTAQTGLIAVVFLFKIAEWWYQSAEPRVTAPTAYPPPPPPPAPKAVEGGLPLPKDPRKCPLCSGTRTNPAMAAVSGFVFCYPCIFTYVQQYERCPITLIPSTVDQIRRLYHSA